MRILVVEDEKNLNDIIVKKLLYEHYCVDFCYNGEAALNCLQCAEYDAIILDIMLPKIDGLEVLKRFRNNNCITPVLLLTARDSIKDRVTGLDRGADDYLIKPFSFDELLARIRAMIRRTSEHISNRFVIADMEVDCDTRTVTRNNAAIALTAKEFDVLEFMVRNRGMVLSRDKLLQHLWNFDYDGGSNIIDVYIRYLRRKIDDGFPLKLIHTIRGIGYVLREEP